MPLPDYIPITSSVQLDGDPTKTIEYISAVVNAIRSSKAKDLLFCLSQRHLDTIYNEYRSLIRHHPRYPEYIAALQSLTSHSGYPAYERTYLNYLPNILCNTYNTLIDTYNLPVDHTFDPGTIDTLPQFYHQNLATYTQVIGLNHNVHTTLDGFQKGVESHNYLKHLFEQNIIPDKIIRTPHARTGQLISAAVTGSSLEITRHPVSRQIAVQYKKYKRSYVPYIVSSYRKERETGPVSIEAMIGNTTVPFHLLPFEQQKSIISAGKLPGFESNAQVAQRVSQFFHNQKNNPETFLYMGGHEIATRQAHKHSRMLCEEPDRHRSLPNGSLSAFVYDKTTGKLYTMLAGVVPTTPDPASTRKPHDTAPHMQKVLMS